MKPGVFTQLYIHLVLAVKYRECLLNENHRTELFKYISGTITHKKHKSIIINGMPDHVHILVGLNPNQSISKLMGDIKRSSSLLIKDQRWFSKEFSWQTGYGAFSYSRSQLDNIYKYILNQQTHHKRKTFREEYIEFLDKNKIEHNKQYLFDFFE